VFSSVQFGKLTNKAHEDHPDKTNKKKITNHEHTSTIADSFPGLIKIKSLYCIFSNLTDSKNSIRIHAKINLPLSHQYHVCFSVLV